MKLDFQKFLIVALVAGCVLHPASSAIGLLIVFGAQVADKYFTRNISDSDRRALDSVKADIEKINKVQQKESLAKAFVARQ
jgi:hypothetical protein